MNPRIKPPLTQYLFFGQLRVFRYFGEHRHFLRAEEGQTLCRTHYHFCFFYSFVFPLPVVTVYEQPEPAHTARHRCPSSLLVPSHETEDLFISLLSGQPLSCQVSCQVGTSPPLFTMDSSRGRVRVKFRPFRRMKTGLLGQKFQSAGFLESVADSAPMILTPLMSGLPLPAVRHILSSRSRVIWILLAPCLLTLSSPFLPRK